MGSFVSKTVEITKTIGKAVLKGASAVLNVFSTIINSAVDLIAEAPMLVLSVVVIIALVAFSSILLRILLSLLGFHLGGVSSGMAI